MPASLPGSGDRIEPWLSEASRAAVSSFSAGTFGATADSSRVLASRSSARNPAGVRSGSAGLGLGQAVRGQQDRPQLVPVQRVGGPEQRGGLRVESIPALTM